MMRAFFVCFAVLILSVTAPADQQTVAVGAAANDGTGDSVRAAFQKVNANFVELFSLTDQLDPTNSTSGDLLQFGSALWEQLPRGTTGQFLKAGAATNLWSDLPIGKINAVTATAYTFTGSDAGKLTTFTNTSAVAVTLGAFADGSVFHTKNLGTGLVTITVASGTIDFAATLILTKGQSASIFSDGTNYRTTLTHPNITSELVANTTTFLNPKALSSKQVLEIYHTTDSYSTPANYARLQASGEVFNWQQVGTGTFAGIKFQGNGATRLGYDPVNGHTTFSSTALLTWASTADVVFNSWDTSLRRKSGGVLSVSLGGNQDLGQYSSINGLSVGSIFTQTADAAVANTTAETSILGTGSGTKTVAAGALNTVGRTLRIRVRGMISNFTGAPALTIRVKIAGVTILTGSVGMVNATNNSFDVETLLTVRSTGSGGSFAAAGDFTHGMTTGSTGAASLAVAGTQVTDLTLSRVVDVTAQWGTAHTSNSITSQIATVEILN